VTDFAAPPGVVTVRIDPATGLLAYEGQEDAIEEVFLAGTEPSETAALPDGGVYDDEDAGAEAPSGAGGSGHGAPEGEQPRAAVAPEEESPALESAAGPEQPGKKKEPPLPSEPPPF
jgi:penicillin-binding protein 1A